ncbi:hypothetical protein ACXX82_00980 [Glaciimonas sp. GNP009]
MTSHLTPAFVFNLLAVVAAIVAAVYWYRSSQVSMPHELVGIALVGGRAHVNTKPLVAAAKESGRLNSIAAGWSAGAALFVAVATVCDAFAHTI